VCCVTSGQQPRSANTHPCGRRCPCPCTVSAILSVLSVTVSAILSAHAVPCQLYYSYLPYCISYTVRTFAQILVFVYGAQVSRTLAIVCLYSLSLAPSSPYSISLSHFPPLEGRGGPPASGSQTTIHSTRTTIHTTGTTIHTTGTTLAHRASTNQVVSLGNLLRRR
jgi:hypothetical protein